MANPVLKKLSNPRISNATIADLLEKHIGDGSNEQHCRQAWVALQRIKHQRLSIAARVLGTLLSNGNNYCEMVRQAAAQIRGPVGEPNEVIPPPVTVA